MMDRLLNSGLSLWLACLVALPITGCSNGNSTSGTNRGNDPTTDSVQELAEALRGLMADDDIGSYDELIEALLADDSIESVVNDPDVQSELSTETVEYLTAYYEDDDSTSFTDYFKSAFKTVIYGFAPVQVAKKEYDQTNVTDDPAYAPLNELYINTDAPSPDNGLWVSPNANVLYSSTHIDLSDAPMVLHTPSIQDRYFSWEIMDAFTNAFSYIGTRATGGVEGTYVFVGPDYSGDIPDGYTQIDAPTNTLWVVGRHEVEPGDDTDLETTVGLVQESILLPLDEYETKADDYVNPIITKGDATVIDELDVEGLDFYTQLNDWLTRNPPLSQDQAIVSTLAEVGVGEGYTTDFSSLSEREQLELRAAEELARIVLTVETFGYGTPLNGWWYNLGSDFGDWGTNYVLRALAARGGLGANINEEAIYPYRLFGPNDELLSGDKKYTFTLTQDQLPVPVSGFWSITPYDLSDGTLIDNSIDRYTLGSQSNLTTADDGSITIYLQSDDPGGDATANWLPTPSDGDRFYILFRAYYPDSEMYTPTDEPTYVIPDLVRVFGD